MELKLFFSTSIFPCFLYDLVMQSILDVCFPLDCPMTPYRNGQNHLPVTIIDAILATALEQSTSHKVNA